MKQHSREGACPEEDRSSPPVFSSTSQTHRQWLLLDESVQQQLGDPVVDEMNDDVVVWEMEFRIKFYVGRSVTDTWDDYARYLFFLQLRDDVSQGKYVSDSPLFFLSCFLSFFGSLPAPHRALTSIPSLHSLPSFSKDCGA